MTIERPISHAAESDTLLADRLRAIPGLVRKGDEDAAKPTPADPFGRSTYKPPVGFVEVPAPTGTRVAPGAPRTRHFRAVEPGKVQRRTMVDAIRQPNPETR